MFENAMKCSTQYIILGNTIQSQEILENTGNVGKCKKVFLGEWGTLLGAWGKLLGPWGTLVGAWGTL